MASYDSYAEKENSRYEEDDFANSEHLRFSMGGTYQRQTLEEYNKQRYSGASGTSGTSRRSDKRSQHSRGGKGSSHDRYRESQGSRQSKSGKSRTSKSTYHSHASSNTNSHDIENTIAIFGAYGTTGHYFLKLAVEAGYHVRALLLPGVQLQDMQENPNVTLITGTFDDEGKIHRVIRKAAYVVCMLNDCQQINQNLSQQPSNFDFVKKLVPLMGESATCRVLLYQASSFSSDAKRSTPMISNVVKKMAVRKVRRENLQEQDSIVKYIVRNIEGKANDDGLDSEDADDKVPMDHPFQFIITRPSDMVWDRPSRKKLAASKSLPGLFPITNIDLAEFSLNALKMDKLYNSCPFVVQDGI